MPPEKKTSSAQIAANRRWDEKNLKSYTVRLNKNKDSELIKLVEAKKEEGYQTSVIFKAALQALLQQENKKDQ